MLAPARLCVAGLSKWVRQLVRHHDTFDGAMQSLAAFSSCQQGAEATHGKVLQGPAGSEQLGPAGQESPPGPGRVPGRAPLSVWGQHQDDSQKSTTPTTTVDPLKSEMADPGPSVNTGVLGYCSRWMLMMN